MKRFFRMIPLLCAACAFAYLPPVDRQSGLELRIMGFDEDSSSKELKVAEVALTGGKPLEINVTAKNQSKAAVSGELRVWMNDDWEVADATRKIELPAGTENQTFTFIATASPRTLRALYPVHATFSFQTEAGTVTLHPIAIFRAIPPAHASANVTEQGIPPTALKPGITRLTSDTDYFASYRFKGDTHPLGQNFSGNDHTSGTLFAKERHTIDGQEKSVFTIHPPWRKGAGDVSAKFPIALPAGEKAKLVFSTAIRENHENEPPSDGTEHKVLVHTANGAVKDLFSRFSKSKSWQPAEVDLSDYAGQSVMLELFTGPGPRNDTTCDQCYWGNPAILIGDLKMKNISPTAEQRNAETVIAAALKQAASAVNGETDTAKGSFRLTVNGTEFGAAVACGPHGIFDGAIAFAASDTNLNLAFYGFECEVDGIPIDSPDFEMPVKRYETAVDGNRLIITHWLTVNRYDQPVPARLTVCADRAALKFAWDMPGVKRDKTGNPRFTKLALGPSTLPVWRAYAGFGNVIERPQNFNLSASGFGLSTRHIGGDYLIDDNGKTISLLQHSAVFPDQLICNAEKKRYALVAHHDNTFSFVPSVKGAFDAARAFRDQSGYRAAPGVKQMLGTMCLDQWGGDYLRAAKDLESAAMYGIEDAVFVKHDWQHWGYDYRLPEIYPPHGKNENFMAMRQAAKDSGILFCPHDNYIDFYPDAEGFSYDQIIFNPNGTPQEAWYNEGRHALSYRWMPHAFRPWMKNNMRLMRDNFAPDSLFIDVFSAISPMDYYDRDHNFYSKERTAREWGDAFNTCRKMLKAQGPMISEAGTDALIGSLDAGQSDHFGAERWMSKNQFADSERVPWHDMVTHGKFVLFAGGLGGRYAAQDWKTNGDPLIHGYGSDDYLSNTVIGGRNPMCDGPFNRRAVATYWLLHDVCAELARESLESHQFGNTVHQQHTTFSNGAEVWINRETNTTVTVVNRDLPPYGFYAKTKNCEAGVVTAHGQRFGFASSPNAIFIDARPAYNATGDKDYSSAVKGGSHLGGGKFKIDCEVTLDKAIKGYAPFVHITPPLDDRKENIIFFQGGMSFPNDALTKTGKFDAAISLALPDDLPSGKYLVRYGFFLPTHGHRAQPGRSQTDLQARVLAGTLLIDRDKGLMEFSKETGWRSTFPPDTNMDGKTVAYHGIVTDGAFRIVYKPRNVLKKIFGFSREWLLVPLPGSRPFSADIDMAALGVKGAEVENISPVNQLTPNGEEKVETQWSQDGDCLSISCHADSAAYLIRFK